MSADAPIAKFTVTAVSQGSWAEYRDRLQPVFNAQADAARAEVLATTARAQDRDVRANSLALSLALPGAAPSSEGPAPADLAPTASSPAFPGIPSTIDLDPMTKYQLATSLYQEIQLLNSYVRDAVIPTGYRGYVARLNLGVMGFKSNQPVDVYATISFFDGVEDGAGAPIPLIPSAAEELNALRASAWTIDSGHVTLAASATGPASSVAPAAPRRPFDREALAAMPGHTRVVPMLATDSIEAAMRTRDTQRIRDLALTLSGGLQSIAGGTASVRNRVESLMSLLARDYNTTYQVFHDSENSILVKIGAANSAKSDKALVSRTFPVSVLLLVPEGLWSEGRYPRISIVAKVALRHPATGKPLDTPSVLSRMVQSASGGFGDDDGMNLATGDFAALKRNLCEKMNEQLKGARAGGSPSPSVLLEADLVRLLLAINDNDYGEYRKILRDYPDLDEFNEEVWTILLEAVAETGFARSSLSLRSEPAPTYAADTSVMPVITDTGKASSIVLTGFNGLVDPEKLVATLRTGPEGNRVTLPGRGLRIGAAGSTLGLEFPSLKALGLKPENVAVAVSWYNSDAETWKPIDQVGDTRLHYCQIPAPPAPTPYSIVPPVKVVTAKHGEPGTLRFTLRRNAAIPIGGARVGVRVGGALIAEISGPNEGGFAVKGDAIVAAAPTADREVQLRLLNFHASPRIELQLIVDNKPLGEPVEIGVRIEK